MRTSITLTTCIAACLALAAPLALADAHLPAPAPTPAVGDSWTYQYTDVWKGIKGNVNKIEVTAVDEQGVHVEIRRAQTNALVGKQLYSAEMNPVDRGAMHFAPSFARFAFPLAPGKEWSTEAVGDNPKQGKHWRYTIKGKVLDWEKVKVPAGEFDALKVVVEALYRGDEANSNGGNGQLTETIWFVPELNNFVKLDYRDTDWQGRIFNRDSWELTSYVRAR
nr:hypothetical protein [uncultured Duganella sp.]